MSRQTVHITVQLIYLLDDKYSIIVTEPNIHNYTNVFLHHEYKKK